MAASGNVQSVAQQKSSASKLGNPEPSMGEGDLFLSDADLQELDLNNLELDTAGMEQAPPNMVDQTQALQGLTDERPYQTRDQVPQDMAQQVPVDQVPPEQIQPIEEGFLGANLNIQQQLEVLPARIRASFGKTPKEKLSALETYLGKENVKAQGDNFLVKLPGKDKFRKLDPETFDIVGDLFADNYRDTLAQMTGAGAVALQGPGALEPVSSALAYAGGVAAGDTVADMVAENVFGIPRDPSRGGAVSKDAGLVERVQSGVERTLDAATYGLSSSLVNEATKKVSNVVSERISQRMAQRELLKKAKEVPEHEILEQTVKNNIDTMNELKALDIIENIPGTDTPIMAHQMLPDTQEARNVAESVKSVKEFKVLQAKAEKQIGDAVLDMIDTAAELGKGTTKRVIESGQKTTKEGLAENVGDLIQSSIKAEGELIGKFRDMAGDKAKGVPVQATKTMEVLRNAVQDFGIRMNQNGGYDFLPDEDLAGLLGTDSKMLINGFKKDITKILSSLQSRGSQGQLGQAAPGDIAGFDIDFLLQNMKLIGDKNPGARRIGGLYQRYIGQISSALRSDAREAIPSLLGPEDGQAYINSMRKFVQFSDARDQISNMLGTEMGANTFSRLLLSKGKQGLANLKATKQFLNETNPELWNNIKNEFFEEIALKHRNLGAKGEIKFNLASMRKELFQGYGKEFLDEMFPSQGKVGGAGLISKAFDLAEQVQRSSIRGTEDETVKLTKDLALATSQFTSAKINAAMAMFGFANQDNKIIKLISKRGIDEFLEKVPKGKVAMMRSALGDMLSYAKNQGIIKFTDTMQSSPVKSSATGALSAEVQQALKGLSQFGGAPRSEIPR